MWTIEKSKISPLTAGIKMEYSGLKQSRIELIAGPVLAMAAFTVPSFIVLLLLERNATVSFSSARTLFPVDTDVLFFVVERALEEEITVSSPSVWPFPDISSFILVSDVWMLAEVGTAASCSSMSSSIMGLKAVPG